MVQDINPNRINKGGAVWRLGSDASYKRPKGVLEVDSAIECGFKGSPKAAEQRDGSRHRGDGQPRGNARIAAARGRGAQAEAGGGASEAQRCDT